MAIFGTHRDPAAESQQQPLLRLLILALSQPLQNALDVSVVADVRKERKLMSTPLCRWVGGAIAIFELLYKSDRRVFTCMMTKPFAYAHAAGTSWLLWQAVARRLLAATKQPQAQ